MCWDVDNLFGWTISQTLPVDGFKQRTNKRKFYEEFIQDYDENSDKKFTFQVHFHYSKKLDELHKLDIMKIGYYKKTFYT